MNRFVAILMIVLAVFPQNASAQDDSSPVKIKLRRIDFKAGNQYSVDIPSLEFHVLLQKRFDSITSSVSTDYDYLRKDMGFGMSHAFNDFIINPGISVDDNLYFRKVFSDSTGIWSRKQSITPFIMHEINQQSSIVLLYKFEREWSPNRREGANIITYYDYSMRVLYLYQSPENNRWLKRLFNISLERSYKIYRGQYNYLLLDAVAQVSQRLNEHISMKHNLLIHASLTPQISPLYFVGGRSSLIGYENDEFWGRRAYYCQNLLEFIPQPGQKKHLFDTTWQDISILLQYDIGGVSGASHLENLRSQDNNIKMGFGLGLGVTTMLPYLNETELYVLVAAPADFPDNIKLYAGFGGWLK